MKQAESARSTAAALSAAQAQLRTTSQQLTAAQEAGAAVEARGDALAHELAEKAAELQAVQQEAMDTWVQCNDAKCASAALPCRTCRSTAFVCG